MFGDFYIEYFFYSFFDGLNSRVAKFNDFPIGKNDMIMLLVEI